MSIKRSWGRRIATTAKENAMAEGDPYYVYYDDELIYEGIVELW